tara:strand:+ start:1647 stop:1877 length:231 start_codon:yes stop_codon:yes gene_type:complete
MKKVVINSLKLNCSKGRIEKGDTVILSDEEIARITKIRPDVLTILEEIKPEPKPKPAAPIAKTVRKFTNAKSKPLN